MAPKLLRNLCSNGGFEHLLSVALDTTKPDKTVTESSLPDLLWIGLAVIGFRAAMGFAAPSALPRGFELSEVRSLPRRSHKGGDESVRPVRLTCTDGLAKLVIYEFPTTENGPGCERSKPGCDRLVAHRKHFADFNVVSAALGRVRLVVCSGLAEEEVRRVLEGLCAAPSSPSP